MAVAVKMIDQRPARIIAVVVNAGNIHEEIKAERLFRELADFRYPVRIRQVQSDLATKFNRSGDQLAESGDNLISEFGRRHRIQLKNYNQSTAIGFKPLLSFVGPGRALSPPYLAP